MMLKTKGKIILGSLLISSDVSWGKNIKKKTIERENCVAEPKLFVSALAQTVKKYRQIR
jgi:hypothetical protein